MEDKELSQWFDINDQNPWELGVYEVREEYDICTNQKWYSYWNGKKFMYYTHISEHDAFEKKSHATGCITTHWRGLASNLSSKPKPKTKGNRKVTRYVVTSDGDAVAAFASKALAEAYAKSIEKRRASVVWVEKIRFRTPEA